MGRATLKMVQNPENILKDEVENCKSVFQKLIFPRSLTIPAFGQEFRKIIQQTIDLRNDMTGELAIYRCLWHVPGDRFTGFEEYDGPEKARTLPLCVFPGFMRNVRRSNGKVDHVLVTRTKIQWK